MAPNNRRILLYVRPAFVLVLILLSFAVLSYAQTIKATIFGTVTDPTGAVVPGAKVTITATGTNTSREVTTGSDGTYVVPLLLPGRYRVQAVKQGFAARIVDSVNLIVDARQEVDLALSVSSAQQEVTASASAEAIDTGTPAIGQLIDEKTITDMPLNGRNFLQLVLLSAGSAPLGAISDTASFNRPSVNISGGRESSNQFTIDGIFDNAIHFEGLNIQPSIDSLQEFNVQRNTFSAEFGHG